MVQTGVDSRVERKEEFYEKLLRSGLASPNPKTRKPGILFRGNGMFRLSDDLALKIDHEQRQAAIGMRVDDKVTVFPSEWHFDFKKGKDGTRFTLDTFTYVHNPASSGKAYKQ